MDENVLELAKLHVRFGELRLARQRKIARELEGSGSERSAEQARRLVLTMEDTLRLMRHHLSMELKKQDDWTGG